MYEWYRSATVCYTYLHDVVWSMPCERMFKSQDAKRKQHDLESDWFERGWTLQELLTPSRLVFYHRRLMGTKNDLVKVLQQVTGIGERYLDQWESNSSSEHRNSELDGRILKRLKMSPIPWMRKYTPAIVLLLIKVRNSY